jgi:rhodanese-related sulfurtransferase
MIPRKLTLFVLCLSGFIGAVAQLPFKFDHTTYRTAYWKEACRLMSGSSGYLLLDVRSPGEYSDTSRFADLNLGRLRNAVNISIDSIPAHLEALKKDKDKTIFVYCSHSQRSRRVSKLLSENGFTHVVNINGGMSVVNTYDATTFPQKKDLLISNTGYTNVASGDALGLILLYQQSHLLIIDIRGQPEFGSTDTTLVKDIGRVRNAINIPADALTGQIGTIAPAKDAKMLVYDQYGSKSAEAAGQLRKMGYTQVYNLYGGLAGLLCDNAVEPGQIKTAVMELPAYRPIGPKACIDLLKRNAVVIIDTRPSPQYENKDSLFYLNLGHLDRAIHLSSPDGLAAVIDPLPKNTEFLVYGQGDGAQEIMVARELIRRGYPDVNVLYQGLYHYVWSCFNLEECKDGIGYLTDHQGLY